MEKINLVLISLILINCHYNYAPISRVDADPFPNVSSSSDLSGDASPGSAGLEQEFHIASIENISGTCERISNNDSTIIEIKSLPHVLDDYKTCDAMWKLNFTNSPPLNFSNIKYIKLELEYKLKSYFYYDLNPLNIGLYLENAEISIAGNNVIIGSVSGYDTSISQGNGRRITITYELPNLSESTVLSLLVKLKCHQRETTIFHNDTNTEIGKKQKYAEIFFYQNSTISVKSVQLIKRL